MDNASGWRPGIGTLTGALCILAGCAAGPRQETQWIDPAVGGHSAYLRGARIMVACEAYDVAAQRVCQDQVARELAAKGATPVMVPTEAAILTDRPLDGQLVASANESGAKAVFVMTLTPAAYSPGPDFSLGIGGFSLGRGGGVGVGLGVPIGGAGGSTGFAANARLTDARANRLVWTATLVAGPEADLTAQFARLARSMADAAQGAGLF
jgi:hypothetical protein